MREQLQKLTQELVKIPSHYPHEKQLCDFLVQYFQDSGCTIDTQDVGDGRSNIIVTKGQGDKSIAFYAHIDTVAPTGTWDNDPYAAHIEDDKLYGIGTYDMKSGMAANICAFNDFEPKDFQLKLILCVDEENISLGAHSLLKTDHLKNVDCIISPEPAFKGLHSITIGRMGRCVYDVEITRDSVHTAHYSPDKDINRVWAKLQEALEELYIEEGTKKQFVFAREMRSEVTGMSLPNKITAQLEAGIIPPQSADMLRDRLIQVMQDVLENFDGVSFTLDYVNRLTDFLDPYEIDKNNAYALKLYDAVQKVTGKTAEPYFRSSVGDDNVFGSRGYTVLGIGPEGANAHAPNEYVHLDSLEQLYNVYMEFLASL